MEKVIRILVALFAACLIIGIADYLFNEVGLVTAILVIIVARVVYKMMTKKPKTTLIIKGK